MAYRNYASAVSHIVDTLGQGDFTTIAAALTASTSGQTIFIRPGTYTENPALVAGVNLTAFGSDSSLNATGKVIINGNCTFSSAGTVTISGIQLQTNSLALLTVSGSAASIVNLNNCYLNCSTTTGISFTTANTSAQINIAYCKGNLGTTGIGIYTNSSTGTLTIEKSSFTNTGASLSASSTSAGSVQLYFNNFSSVFSTSSTATMSFFKCVFDTSSINTTILTTAGTGTQTISHCYFASGSASAISVGTGTTVNATLCTVNSSNTNAITGAGTGTAVLVSINYTGTSHQTNVPIQTGGAVNGLTQGTAPSVGMLGERISSAVTGGTPANNTPTTLTSIALTPGVWDISCIATFAFTGFSTIVLANISTTTNTIVGALGDAYVQLNYVSATGLTQSLSLPNFRVTTTSSPTYYLVVQNNFSTGATSVNGRISAVRVG